VFRIPIRRFDWEKNVPLISRINKTP